MSLGSKWTTALTSTQQSKWTILDSRKATLIIPRLYLSDYFTACNSDELDRLGITHIVSVLDNDISLPDRIPKSHKLHVRVADRSDEDLLIYFPKTTQFISAALAENDSNNVLVSSHNLLAIGKPDPVKAAIGSLYHGY